MHLKLNNTRTKLKRMFSNEIGTSRSKCFTENGLRKFFKNKNHQCEPVHYWLIVGFSLWFSPAVESPVNTVCTGGCPTVSVRLSAISAIARTFRYVWFPYTLLIVPPWHSWVLRFLLVFVSYGKTADVQCVSAIVAITTPVSSSAYV